MNDNKLDDLFHDLDSLDLFSTRDIYDDVVEYHAKRVGLRIREHRTALNMTQAELGELVGLNANRIQQYENGARTPKLDLLKKIAAEMSIQVSALEDPSFATNYGIMYGLFEMNRDYPIEIEVKDNKAFLSFSDEELNNMLIKWYEKRVLTKESLEVSKSKMETNYINQKMNYWENNFPFDMEKFKTLEQQRIELRESIKILQQKLDELNNSEE